MLGLGASLTSSFNSETGVVIEDYMWAGVSNGGVAGELTPRPVAYDFNDIWDLDDDVETDYTLQDSSVYIMDEGYWDLDSNTDVQPLDV